MNVYESYKLLLSSCIFLNCTHIILTISWSDYTWTDNLSSLTLELPSSQFDCLLTFKY